MSNLGLVLNIAKSALSAQQYGLEVTSHNIANVNNPDYSRQTVVQVPKYPAPYGGVIIGRGVDVDEIIRISDQFIEEQLIEQKANLKSSEEMENYITILEGILTENTEGSMSDLLSTFWNLWHDIANNPSSTPERIALYEHSLSLSARFNEIKNEILNMQNDLNNAMRSAIEKINEICSEIAQLNNQIVGLESSSTANDLRDQRNALVSELSQYINAKTYEQENGSLTVITAKGCVLVQGIDSYALELGGSNEDRVLWEGSGGRKTDITDNIDNGKLGGWLNMRDEVLEKYRLDLDEVAKELIWYVNRQHSQGVGLNGFEQVTTTYSVTDTSEELGTSDSGLDFYDRIQDGSFKIWVYDSSGNVVNTGGTTITIDADPGGTTLTSLKDDINTQLSSYLTASITSDNNLSITAASGYTFAFSDDTSYVLSALGINTFFTGSGAGSIGVNESIEEDKDLISAGLIESDGTFANGDNRNALSIIGIQNQEITISQWTCDRINGNTEGNVTSTIEDYYHSLVGSVGIRSSSIRRTRQFYGTMVEKISEIRDSISAVSLDEEMTNIIKYQQAYTAAAKLISVSDEMLKDLLNIK